MTTPELEHTAPPAISQADFHALLRDKVCLAVQLMLNQVLDVEVEAFIGAARWYVNSCVKRWGGSALGLDGDPAKFQAADHRIKQ